MTARSHAPMRQCRIRHGLIAVAVGACMVQTAIADTAVCTGKITTLGNHVNGNNGLHVVVGNSNIIRVCSFTTTQFTVTPEDCRHIASIAALAYATGDSVTFYIDNAPSNLCSSVPGWHTANTRFFALSK
jgi:hypothetical protein